MSQGLTVTVYDTHRHVQDAIKAFKSAGCNLDTLSVVGKDCCSSGQSLNFNTDAADQKKLAESVSFWNKMWHTLSGDAFLTVDGIGPILVAGPLAERIVDAWTDLGGEEDLSPLRKALRSFRIPLKSIAEYEAAVQEGRYLVAVSGNRQEGGRDAKALHSPAGAGRAASMKPAQLPEYGTAELRTARS